MSSEHVSSQHPRSQQRGAMFLVPVIGLTFLLANVVEASEVWPTNNWSRATPEELGMNAIKLQKARYNALSGGGSGLIIRGGRVAISWGSEHQTYDLKSTTKSIGITALGLAIGDGKITFHDKAQKFHPDFGIPPDTNVETGWLDDIRVLHLATMTAGFDKPGGYTKLLFAPGSKWAYSDGGANWLAECITLAYKRDLYSLMFERVFKPVGIKKTGLTWRDHAYRPHAINGVSRREFGSGIHANIDAMARIGYIYLRKGKWHGQQIISPSFVNSVSTVMPSLNGLPVMNDNQSRFANASKHYGMFWWNNADGTLANVPRDSYWSWGGNDNMIIVIPSLDLVIARAGSTWSGNKSPNYYNSIKPFLQAIAESVRPTLW
jgi:CubicO group peptidase (beta-lactamase class C family)